MTTPRVHVRYRSISDSDSIVPNLDCAISIPKAACLVGIPSWKIRKAVSLRLIPVYQIANSRKLVKPSEILAALHASRKGGE